jgi:glycosyltransferase involved in cell wall biosynthesis
MAPSFMDVRTTQPMNALAKIPGITTEMLIREMKVEPIKDKSIPHILILQRHIPQNAKEWKEKMMRVADMGWLVVSEWDDHPDKLPPGIRERFGEAGWMAFTAAHAVQTSTAYLQAVFKKLNPNTLLFPNCVESVREDRELPEKPETIFFGALNRKADWMPIMNQLNRFAKENLHIKWNVMLDKEFFEKLETDNKNFVEAGNYQRYLSELDKSDICLMPLADTEANRCKSDIKYVEASSRGTASVMSTVVYAGTLPDSSSGFVVKDNEWYEALSKLVNEPKLAQNLAKNARNYVLENRLLNVCINERYEGYKSIFKNKEKLTEKLIERMVIVP